MTDRAFVYLFRGIDQRARFVGIVGVKPRPAKGAQVQLLFPGKIVSGRVVAISPNYWKGGIAITPTIQVMLNKPKGATARVAKSVLTRR